MADTTISTTPIKSNPPISKKPRNKRNPLKQKNPSTNEANIIAQEVSVISPPVTVLPADTHPLKENRSSPKKSKGRVAKSKQAKQSSDASFEKEMQEMQEMLQRLKIEKEKTEEMLEKDEILKAKEEELENRGKEQEKLQMELKKLQKLKEFKPNVSFSLVQPLKDDQNKKKKKGSHEMKRPSTPYILWCKDQWNEATPQANLSDEHIIALTKRTREGGTEVVEAKAGKGSATLSIVFQLEFDDLAYVRLGKNGVEEVLGLGSLSSGSTII